MKIRVTNVAACSGGEHLTIIATVNDNGSRTYEILKSDIVNAKVTEADEARELMIHLLRQEVFRAGVQNGTPAQQRTAVINKDYYV